MKISSQEEYGLRCLLQLAQINGDSLSIRDIARAEGLSESYVGKLLFLLRKKGLVKSTRGTKGGYRLARSPQTITLLLVLKALAPLPKTDNEICQQYPGEKKNCVHLNSGCGIRTVWHTLYKNIWQTLQNTTLADLVKESALANGRTLTVFEKEGSKSYASS